MRALILALTMLSASPAWAASDAYCTQYAILTSANATTIKQVDHLWAHCLNQNLDPRVDTAPIPAGSHYPGCRRFRSYDPKSHSFLDYSHKRRPCP